MDWRDDFDHSLLDDESLEFLIEHELGGPAVGVTAQVIKKGLYSLSEKQLYVFKTYVVDVWLSQTCECCQTIEGHNLIGLWMNDGYCGDCAYRMDREARAAGISNW